MAGAAGDLKALQRELAALTKRVREAAKATEESTGATEERTKVERERAGWGERAAGVAATGATGAIRSLAQSMADPFITPGEMTRRAGRAAGAALGGVKILGTALGAEAGGFIGEFGAAALGDITEGAAVRNMVGAKVEAAREAVTGTLSAAERQRFVEGAEQQVAGLVARRAGLGLETPDEVAMRLLEQSRRVREREWEGKSKFFNRLYGTNLRGASQP